ncbi:MAG: HNH endonuclease signature motif containing protein [Actinomycetota bacterium]
MFNGLVDQALDLLQRAVEGLDPDTLDPAVAMSLTEKFCRMERLCAAGKALTANRVAGSGAWIETSERSPAHWVATESKCTVGHAVRVLETAEHIKRLDAASCAYRKGELSETQAYDLCAAAKLDPEAQAELLEATELQSVYEFKRSCARARAAAMSAEQRHTELHGKRYLRHWSDVHGAFCLEGRLTPETGAQVLAALEPFRQKIAERSRRERPDGSRQARSRWLGGHGSDSVGSHSRYRSTKRRRKDSADAQAADALVEMAREPRSMPEDAFRPGPRAVVHVRVDHSALVRGETEPGEICEVPGVGPISVDAARAFASDAFVAAILTDGKDVQAVSHMGRTIPAHLRTALIERDPGCVVPGCAEKGPFEIDHVKPVAEGGATRLSNLARLCGWHHYLKTFHRYQLTGGPGRWLWVEPNGPPADELDEQPELVAAR